MRLSEIDDSNRGDHARLDEDDRCLFIFEYTRGQGYSFSSTNGLISNLKKKPTAKEAELYYKGRAINECAKELREALNPQWLDIATVIPVPGSKSAEHPDFDNRMERVARLIRPGLDVRNLVIQTQSTEAAHEVGPFGNRVTVEDLVYLYRINEDVAAPAPQAIGVLDDVLTAGTHFKAMKIVLSERFAGVPITGLFIARRVFPPASADFEGIEIDL